MGKAKRAKLNRQLEEQRRAEAEAVRRAEKKETAKIYISVIAIILVISIIVTAICLVINSVKKTGDYLRDKISITTENFEVNNAMLSYFFADNFYMQKSYFDYYASYFGLNTSDPLKIQKYNNDMSWYDYFLNAAIDNTASILISCEGALADGVELDDNDRFLIDKEIDLLKKDAEELEMDFEEYLSEYYGLGVKEDDVRDALEIYYLSTKYYYHQIGAIDVTDAEITEYYEEHEKEYLRVSYKAYAVKALVESGATAAEKEAAYKLAEERANKIAAAKTAEEYDQLLTEYLTDLHKRDGSKDVKAEDIKKEVEAATYESAAYNEDSEYSKWLFDDKTKVGDTKVIDNKSGTYTVYMLTSAKAREEYTTHDVRHILLLENDYESKAECEAAAKAVLDAFNATDKSMEEFEKLVLEHSADTGSVYLGGLYESVTKGQMVKEFEDWCYDEKREAGDCELVYTESYGYHIMYYVGEGEQAWEAAVHDAILNEEYTEISKDLTDTVKVNVDSKKANNIPDVN